MPLRTPISLERINNYLKLIKGFKTGFDLLNDHIVITDVNANILYANKAAEINTGFLLEEMIGKNPADLWGGNMTKDFYDKMWQTIKIEKKPFVGEVHNKRKDGKEYWQEIHVSPILDERGEVNFFIAIEPNITDRKKKEQFREEFISVLGHQALTPATVIRWTLEKLLKKEGEEKQKNSEQIQSLKNIYSQTKDLIDLIDDLLFVSRMGSGHPERISVNLIDEIKNIIDTAKKRYPKINFIFGAKGNFIAQANQLMVSQILGNIINNAAERSNPQKGEVVIDIKNNQKEFIFSCGDNGMGISKGDLDKIFSNTRRINKSDGDLNLFIVKIIADSLGWNITFKSEVGKGTIFYIFIPKMQI